LKSTSAIAIAIAAHPDDIEFYMAGTLLLLRKAGWETHCFNLSSGNCGSARYGAAKTRVIRRKEAQQASRQLGAHWHPPMADDLEIFYSIEALRRVTAVIREVRPRLVLTHAPQDYMEDHMNTCRLTVTAAFARGMPNFKSSPVRKSIEGDVTIYHAMPHGLRDGLRRRVTPGLFVNTSLVQAQKREALAAHASQKAWLDASQGMDSYLRAMDEMSLAVGTMSRRFQHAEGWRRHSHLGFCAPNADPLCDALGGNCFINARYERGLEAAGHS
jgi:LmbE family N-acetylglucosaminyl deacetylase